MVHLGLALDVGFIVCKYLESETGIGGWVRARCALGEEPSLERPYSGISQRTVSQPIPLHSLPALVGARVETILPVGARLY